MLITDALEVVLEKKRREDQQARDVLLWNLAVGGNEHQTMDKVFPNWQSSEMNGLKSDGNSGGRCHFALCWQLECCPLGSAATGRTLVSLASWSCQCSELPQNPLKSVLRVAEAPHAAVIGGALKAQVCQQPHCVQGGVQLR